MASAIAACAQNSTATKYAKYITAEDARKHLSILASDEFEGRETGKPGADKAANYIANEFKKLGLQAPVNGSYFLNIPLVETSFNVNNFTLNGTPYTFGKDFYATGNSDAKTLNAKEVVFIGYGSAEELANADIAGKVVLMISGAKPGAAAGTRASRAQLMQRLAEKGPAMVLNANANLAAMLQRMAGQLGGGRLEIKKDNAAPARQQPVTVTVTPEMADQLLKNSGKTYAQLKTAADAGVATETLKADISAAYGSVKKDVKAVDVLGYMPGSDAKLKNEVLVISGHYDHIGLNPNGPDKVNNGADDDGSGTTGVLEIARAFSMAKKAGKGPRRSILFLGNVGEEKGLLGSEFYTDHPVFPLANTITDLNIDMIGRIGFDYQNKPDSANNLYVIGSAMLSSDLRKITEEVNNKYTQIHLDYKYDDPADPNRFYYRSDHYNFAKHGVPIIFYFNGVHQDYHQPGDEVSKINFPLLAKRAQLVFYTGWELANRDQRPVVDGKANSDGTN
ncbi:hypothetical protein GCM10027037_30130 [Mucilaginibacter koreensis]